MIVLKRFVNKKRRYLFLIPVIVLIGFSLFFANLNEENKAGLLDQRVNGMRREVDLVSASISHLASQNDGWDASERSNAAYLMHSLIRINCMYGAVYDEDLNVVAQQLLSEYISTDEQHPFNPLQSEIFTAMVHDNDNGTLVLPYEHNGNMESIHLYFQWAPLGGEDDSRLLVCAGVMASRVLPPTGNILTSASTGMIVMIFVTFLLNVILIELITIAGKDIGSDDK